MVIQKCNLSKSKFIGIFLNCIKEKGFKYKGFRHRIRDSYSCTEQAKSYWTFGLIFLWFLVWPFTSHTWSAQGNHKIISIGFNGWEIKVLISLWISFLISKLPTSELNVSNALQYPWRESDIAMLTVLIANSHIAYKSRLIQAFQWWWQRCEICTRVPSTPEELGKRQKD